MFDRLQVFDFIIFSAKRSLLAIKNYLKVLQMGYMTELERHKIVSIIFSSRF